MQERIERDVLLSQQEEEIRRLAVQLDKAQVEKEAVKKQLADAEQGAERRRKLQEMDSAKQRSMLEAETRLRRTQEKVQLPTLPGAAEKAVWQSPYGVSVFGR